MGTHRSRHNKGRKPLYKEHGSDPVQALLEQPWLRRRFSFAEIKAQNRSARNAEAVERTLEELMGRQRYVGGLTLSTGTTWTPQEQSDLKVLISGGVTPYEASVILGREETSLVSRAKDLGIKLRHALPEWRGPAAVEAFIRRQERATEREQQRARHIIDVAHRRQERALQSAERAAMQYPYIIKKRDSHADILAINAIVPKAIPASMRGDICQEAMLAVLEGRTTLESLKDKGARWFVAQFYKNNFEDGGRALSLTAEGRDGDEYDRIEASISQDEWRYNEMNERRSSWDVINNRFYAPTQIDDVYGHQVKNEQRRLHVKDGKNLDYFEAEEELRRMDPKTFRHLEVGVLHSHDRLEERYGIRWTPAINREIRAAISDNRVAGIERRDNDGSCTGWIRVQGKNVKVAFDPASATVITILPPNQRTSKTYRERIREEAELVFK